MINVYICTTQNKNNKKMEKQIEDFIENLGYIGLSPNDFFNISIWRDGQPITCMGHKNEVNIDKINQPYSFCKNTLTGYSEYDFTQCNILMILI
jgi:hypothetical protein